MFSQYFGNYLLNHSYVSPDELDYVMNLQKDVGLKLGVLSINHGYMSATEVQTVHDLQRQQDKQFGELAVEKGFLTRQQLTELLSSQKSEHLLLGQMLVEENIMTLTDFSRAVENYKHEHHLSDEEFLSLQNNDIDVTIEKMLLLHEVNDKGTLQDYLSLFARNMIRFTEPHIRLEAGEEPSRPQEWTVMQEISGEKHLYTALRMDEPTFLKLASQYAGEYIDEADEFAQASVSELLNLHNGLFLVNMSNKGMELEITPQNIYYNKTLHGAELHHTVSVHFPYGECQLIFSENPLHIQG
ncbi:chemotaxis protein CheX [Salsuginibacillus kocurii]|uniref:chemotaxis protein CheX n=1 Tax=Salsuginibacillus kocurii TaxID=427078 RepID=UPI0003640CEE|nr:chemotaxis protein CheX [Salsuginibacillus kocurii]